MKRTFFFSSVADALHAPVQPPRQAETPEMVRRSPGQDEEEDRQGAHSHHPDEETENVFFSRVEGLENRLQKVPSSLLPCPILSPELMDSLF